MNISTNCLDFPQLVARSLYFTAMSFWNFVDVFLFYKFRIDLPIFVCLFVAVDLSFH